MNLKCLFLKHDWEGVEKSNSIIEASRWLDVNGDNEVSYMDFYKFIETKALSNKVCLRCGLKKNDLDNFRKDLPILYDDYKRYCRAVEREIQQAQEEKEFRLYKAKELYNKK